MSPPLALLALWAAIPAPAAIAVAHMDGWRSALLVESMGPAGYFGFALCCVHRRAVEAEEADVMYRA
jgi:hypothetical protein